MYENANGVDESVGAADQLNESDLTKLGFAYVW